MTPRSSTSSKAVSKKRYGRPEPWLFRHNDSSEHSQGGDGCAVWGQRVSRNDGDELCFAHDIFLRSMTAKSFFSTAWFKSTGTYPNRCSHSPNIGSTGCQILSGPCSTRSRDVRILRAPWTPPMEPRPWRAM